MGYMEESGFGMEIFRSLAEKYNLPLPEYSYNNPFLILTFPRNIEAVKKVSKEKAITKLTKEEIAGFEWVKSKREVSTKQYADHFSYSQRTATRHLVKMHHLGLLSDNGENPKSPKLKYLYKG
jgi:ATP-dependent DNA helicase RecG